MPNCSRSAVCNVARSFPALLICGTESKKDLRSTQDASNFATNWFPENINIAMRRDIFQAIADPTRRAIIVLIATQAMTPNALAEHFDTSRQAVSKHLKILTECELIKQKHQGREIYYQLEMNKMKEIDHWLEQFRKIWEDRFNQLDAVLLNMNKNKP
jgi:DNA-binding transcriptional ArsR family regulator